MLYIFIILLYNCGNMAAEMNMSPEGKMRQPHERPNEQEIQEMASRVREMQLPEKRAWKEDRDAVRDVLVQYGWTPRFMPEVIDQVMEEVSGIRERSIMAGIQSRADAAHERSWMRQHESRQDDRDEEHFRS